jgi:hypothetical protein
MLREIVVRRGSIGGMRATSSSTSTSGRRTLSITVLEVAIVAVATGRVWHGAAHNGRSGATTLLLLMS